MPPSSHKTERPPSNTTRLLELALRPALFLSQNHQPHILCPLSATAAPLYSQTTLSWLTHAAQQQLGLLPSPQQLGRVISALDHQARTSAIIETLHTRTAAIAPKSYQIDLGTLDQRTIQVTGKQWNLSESRTVQFTRPETADELPIPVPCPIPAATCLAKMFDIPEADAHLLSCWLAQALLPDQKPPILVITGEANYEAVTKLRKLVDPVFHEIIELPANQKQLAQQAIENRILAYSTYSDLSPRKAEQLRAVSRAMPARLCQANKKYAPLYTTVHRPVIIAADKPITVSPTQITIRIDKAHQAYAHELLGAILDVVVEIAGQPVEYPEPLIFTVPELPEVQKEPVAEIDTS